MVRYTTDEQQAPHGITYRHWMAKMLAWVNPLGVVLHQSVLRNDVMLVENNAPSTMGTLKQPNIRPPITLA